MLAKAVGASTAVSSTALVSAGLRLFGTLASFALVAVTIGALTVDEFGRYASLVAASQLVALPIVALQRPVLRQFSSRPDLDLSSVYLSLARQAGGYALAVVIAVSIIPALTDVPARAAWFVGVLALMSGTIQVVQAAHRGQGDFVRGQAPYEFARPILAIAATGAMISFGRLTLDGALVATCAGAIGAMVLLMVASGRGERRREPLAISRSSLNWFILATVAGAMIGRAEILALDVLGRPDSAGSLAVAVRIAQLGAFALSFANFRYAPTIASSLASGSGRDAAAAVRRSLTLGLVGGLPIAFVMIATPAVATAPFGGASDGRGLNVAIAGIGLCFNVLAGPAMTVLAMAGLEKTVGLVQLAAAAASLAITWTLTSHTVAAGAIGFATGTAVWNLALAWVAHRRLGIDCTPLCLVRSPT